MPPRERAPPQVTKTNRAQKSDHPTLERLVSGTDDMLSRGGLAPSAPFRATRSTTDIRMREAFADWDLADVASADQQSSTQAAIVAKSAALLSRPASAAHAN